MVHRHNSHFDFHCWEWEWVWQHSAAAEGGTTDLVLLLQSNHFREVDYGALHAGEMADNMSSEATRYPIVPSTPVYAFHDNEDLLPWPVCAGLPFHHCLTEKSFQVGHV